MIPEYLGLLKKWQISNYDNKSTDQTFTDLIFDLTNFREQIQNLFNVWYFSFILEQI